MPSSSFGHVGIHVWHPFVCARTIESKHLPDSVLQFAKPNRTIAWLRSRPFVSGVYTYIQTTSWTNHPYSVRVTLVGPTTIPRCGYCKQLEFTSSMVSPLGQVLLGLGSRTTTKIVR